MTSLEALNISATAEMLKVAEQQLKARQILSKIMVSRTMAQVGISDAEIDGCRVLPSFWFTPQLTRCIQSFAPSITIALLLDRNLWAQRL